MSTASWRKSPSVIEELTKTPARYQFLQAVRLLQYADHSRVKPEESKGKQKNQEIAQYAPSTKEFIRFHTEQRLAFAPSEVTEITRPAKDDKESLLNTSL